MVIIRCIRGDIIYSQLKDQDCNVIIIITNKIQLIIIFFVFSLYIQVHIYMCV
jgi:hypothetical protein